jgi:hypothetical protein
MRQRPETVDRHDIRNIAEYVAVVKNVRNTPVHREVRDLVDRQPEEVNYKAFCGELDQAVNQYQVVAVMQYVELLKDKLMKLNLGHDWFL